MTADTPARCEPPEAWRGVDGWHELQSARHGRFMARWMPGLGVWFHDSMHWKPDDVPWRYHSPVTPPATVAALVEALEECAAELEAEIDYRYNFPGENSPYPSENQRKRRDMETVRNARAAIAAYRGEVGR